MTTDVCYLVREWHSSDSFILAGFRSKLAAEEFVRPILEGNDKWYYDANNDLPHTTNYHDVEIVEVIMRG